MSEDNLSSQEEEEPRQPGRGVLISLGILLGTPALYALYFGTTAGIAPDEGYKTPLAGPAALVPVLVYLAVAGGLAIWKRTSGFGAGLLIGLGIFVLLGGGICVMALSQMSSRI